MFVRWFVTNKVLLIHLFWITTLVGLITLVWLMQPTYKSMWSPMGVLAAKTAVITYLITLLPGMIKRFGMPHLLQPIQVILMTFRRQIGVLSFLSALIHALFSFGLNRLPDLMRLIPQSPSNWFAWTALILLFVLFVTSNDSSVRIMGAWWNKLHNLTHLTIWAILFHVALRDIGPYAILIGVVGLINVISFFVSCFKKPVPQPVFT